MISKAWPWVEIHFSKRLGAAVNLEKHSLELQAGGVGWGKLQREKMK